MFCKTTKTNGLAPLKYSTGLRQKADELLRNVPQDDDKKRIFPVWLQFQRRREKVCKKREGICNRGRGILTAVYGGIRRIQDYLGECNGTKRREQQNESMDTIRVAFKGIIPPTITGMVGGHIPETDNMRINLNPIFDQFFPFVRFSTPLFPYSGPALGRQKWVKTTHTPSCCY